MPSTMKLLSELERSWAMFSATWKVVDLFGGLQVYQQQVLVRLSMLYSPVALIDHSLDYTRYYVLLCLH